MIPMPTRMAASAALACQLPSMATARLRIAMAIDSMAPTAPAPVATIRKRTSPGGMTIATGVSTAATSSAARPAHLR